MKIFWWIVGLDTNDKVVVMDRHNDDGTFADKYPKCVNIDNQREASLVVAQYASKHGITELIYDEDSTKVFAKD
jgi:hypothetical protein